MVMNIMACAIALWTIFPSTSSASSLELQLVTLRDPAQGWLEYYVQVRAAVQLQLSPYTYRYPNIRVVRQALKRNSPPKNSLSWWLMDFGEGQR